MIVEKLLHFTGRLDRKLWLDMVRNHNNQHITTETTDSCVVLRS